MSEIIKKTFKKYLELSDSLRVDYSNSLDIKDDEKLDNIVGIPDVLYPIYSKVNGTLYEVEDQSLMDFIPGFLLIHISEYEGFKSKITKMLSEGASYFPILVNYSSDFYVIKLRDKKDNGIFLINHDELKPTKIHNSFEDFFETIIAFYEKKVFFLDKDGYLDIDFDKEEEVAQELNPEIPFWFEE
ncbi:SMI1/KNR4 family protein [Tenacibaculum maritimum]|uniref:SMI1/KNR4 family protein n=1 Tax=Tenacibaculum maritimum TaxID=107401 RepID=UPI0012E5CF55|nr:SMI1/KNR4 family protein [Tenacibaculum maritimum]MCD9583402.1 SMI1/KNR4 family protein [Tenacibaculum maritimum]MCD9637328.1 SMI1/KNR4 family protein [Tenacibaculum maritimum]CAA0156243.1 conserved hypothetical protein [Tenacibaculum maritimum]